MSDEKTGVTCEMVGAVDEGHGTVGETGRACCRHKSTPRSEDVKKSVTRRINRAIGQLNGIKTMLEDDRYCGDVLTQLAAVESAVRAVSREVMRDHLETCVVERIQEGDLEVTDEVMSLFKKFM